MANQSGKRAGAKLTLVVLSVFLFLLLFAPTASAATYGDINNDGKINVQDVVLVMKHVLELETLTDAQKAVADVNGDGAINVQDVTLIMQYALGLIDEFPHAALTVSKVTAVNPKQVEVEFNRMLNAEEKTKMTTANFHVGLQAAPLVDRLTGTGSAVAVKEDGKTALLTMADGYYFVNGSSTNRVVVKQAVGLAADYVVTNLAFVDTSVPTLVSVETISPRKIVMTFSEPLDRTILIPTNITLDAGAVALNLAGATYVDARRELIVEAFSDLTAGTHTLAILSGTNLKDYSGFSVAPTSKTFTHTPITTAPTVSVKSATESTVTLEFSRAINPATLIGNTSVLFRHTYDTTFNQVTGTSVTNPSGDSRTFVVNFGTKLLPPGSTTVWMKYADGTLDANKIKDTWGNIIPPATLTANVVADTVAPTATVTVFSTTQIDVQYSKEVTGATTPANYSLKKGTDTVTISGFTSLGGNKYRLTVPSMQGSYTLTISNIKDTSPAENAMGTQTYNFDVPDTIKPTVLTTSRLLTGSDKKVQVFFSEAMDITSITDRSKYTYSGNLPLPAAVTITAAGNQKSVLLDFTGTSVVLAVGDTITVGRVKDVAGNETLALSTVTTIAAAEYIDLYKAEATALNRVELTIDAVIANVSPNDFAIDPGPGGYEKAAALITVSYNAGRTVIVLETATDLPYDATGVLVRTEAALALGQGFTANARDEFGNRLNFNDEAVADKIAPALIVTNAIVKVDINGNNRVDHLAIEFTENMSAGSISADKFQVSGYTVVDAYAATIGGTPTWNGRGTVVVGDSKYILVRVTEKTFDDTGDILLVTISNTVRDVSLNAFPGVTNKQSTVTTIP